METADLILGIAVPLVAMLAGWVGVEMSLTPADKLTAEQRRNYRAIFVILMLTAICLNIWQTARNAKQQESARVIAAQKDNENTQRQNQLSNKVSEEGGKLDAITHFEQQFLSFVQQRPTSDTTAKAYETMASAVIRLAQGTGSAPPPPPGGRLEIIYDGSDLDGKAITVSNVQNGSFQLAGFHTKNVGTRATGPTSVRLYLNRAVASMNPVWQVTDSEEAGYPVCFYSTGLPAITINPKETWNWIPFAGVAQNWQQGETISAKVKFFYGTDKPSEANFTIRK